MPRNSLKKLKDKFPYFLDKSDDSNFTKTQKVFNNRLVDVYNELFQVYLAGILEKDLLIWKEQVSANDYTINFVANYPYLETVTCYKNDEVIYTETFSYEDEIHSFNYSYESTSENIIPDDKFKIRVTTHEEYSMVKGFPENDESLGNEYDHDPSLDSFGAFYNIPRKKYKILTDDDLAIMNETRIINYYKKTEPPFNDKASEDDYHYMNRIISYIEYYDKIPLPALEIWKLYGLDPENPKLVKITNREKYLCKMFETNRHLNSKGEYDDSWEPERWEHKDTIWCPVKPEIFFFADVNNQSPVLGRSIIFSFDFIDEFARKSDNDYYIVPYVLRHYNDEDEAEGITYEKYQDGLKIYTKEDGFLWGVSTNDFGDAYILDFLFKAYESYDDMMAENSNYLESDVIRIMIKGCTTADIYVDCVDGLDTNDGKTRNKAFRTLEHALSQMHGSENVIALVNKDQYFNIDNMQTIDETCSIISCPAGATIYQNNGWQFFKIMQDKSLYLQNISLKHKCCTMHSTSTEFVDENVLNYPIYVNIPKWVCKTANKIKMTNNYTVYAHTNVSLTGQLLTTNGDYEVGAEYVDGITKNCPTTSIKPNQAINNENINFYLDNNLLGNETTNNNGEYEFNHVFEKDGNFLITAIHNESTKYCNSENNYNVLVKPMPTTMDIRNAPDKIFIEDSFTLRYKIIDKMFSEISIGTLKLYEDNRLVKTVQNPDELTYTPTTAGVHIYRLEWSHDSSYLSCSNEFIVNVVKYDTRLVLIGNKSIYISSENVEITGLLTDELGNKMGNMSVKIYDESTLLQTLTTNSNGEISYSGRLAIGTHKLHLEFVETDKYYYSVSNSYRVRVRDSELADIQLYIYPEHKILENQPTNLLLNVYACNKNGEPLSTDFKIGTTYDSSCESISSEINTTNENGWWSGSINTRAISECHGTYVQAISTIDSDVYSNVIHIRDSVEPELDVTTSIFVDKSIYSYNNEVIHVSGDLIDEEENPVPNENISINVYANDTIVKTIDLTTDIKGEFETIYTTNKNVRGHDITFEVVCTKHPGAYNASNDEVNVTFKQLLTRIHTQNLSINEGDYIDVNGSVIDENNIQVDEGDITIFFNDETYVIELSDGSFEVEFDDILEVGSHDLEITYDENPYYKASGKEINVDVKQINSVLTLNKANYSYGDENVILSGFLLTEDNIPVSDDFIIKVHVDNNLVDTLNIRSENDGSFEENYVVQSSYRGKDIIFKLEYYKRNGNYLVCETEKLLSFKQLSTTILANSVSCTVGQKIKLSGSIDDENNRLVDSGSVKITFDGTDYNVNLINGNFELKIDKLLTATNYQAIIVYNENTFYKTSNKSVTVNISKLAPIISIAKSHTLVKYEEYILPYYFELPLVEDAISTTVPISGTLKLKKIDNSDIASINVNNELRLEFNEEDTIQSNLIYSGNEYIYSLNITGIILKIIEPSISIKNTENSPWDINILDEFPSNTSNYDENNYLILTTEKDDGNPKLRITNDSDDNEGNEDDIVLVDTDENIEIILED